MFLHMQQEDKDNACMLFGRDCIHSLRKHDSPLTKMHIFKVDVPPTHLKYHYLNSIVWEIEAASKTRKILPITQWAQGLRS